MKEVILDVVMRERVQKIYQQMEAEYDAVAAQLQFSCDGCPDNCCDSYFQHHTYVEWGYLWVGFCRLPATQQETVLERCRKYISECEQALQLKSRPQIMCPLNENERCILYDYRMMVCRTHGVPASMQRPDGQRLQFPGCFRCQDVVKIGYPNEVESPRVERTALMYALARLENELLQGKRHLYPRIQKTIAQMLVAGPPSIAIPYCERQ